MRARPLITAAAALALLAAAAWGGYRLALHRLQAAVLDALGPRASVGALEVGWQGVTVHELRIAAERGGSPAWPAPDELRASRVHLVPDLRSAWPGAAWRLHSVDVQGAYLSLLRTRDGRLRLLPALLERAEAPTRSGGLVGMVLAGAAAPPSSPALRIGEVRLHGAVVELHDASVRSPPHKLRLVDLEATLGDLVLPQADTTMPLTLRAVLKGPQRDGRLAIDGELGLARRDARLDAHFDGVDLVALQPYLLKVAEGGVKRGTLDLRLQATVKANRLRAPGTVTLSGLVLGNSGGALGGLAGVPRQAVLAAMSRDGRIELKFTLEGRLDDPNFSLNESLATRVASGLAETLGVSVGGVVEGVGGLLKGLFGR